MRHIRIGILPLIILLAFACGGGDNGDPTTTPICAPANGATSASLSCWTMLRPLGSGGFPADPGDNDQPKWQPGKIPVTMQPFVAFNGDLWMSSQTSSFSSPDGLQWTHHDKTDTGSRIWQTTVFFDNYLWTFGGMEYTSRVLQNEIWRSADGSTWEDVGEAAWTPRKSAAVVVYQDKLWLFGGATHVLNDFTSDKLANDVWTSQDGVNWTQVTDAAPWAPIDDAHVTVFNDALYLLGGDGRNDVWRSTDGKSWTELTAAAPWKVRHGYTGIAFDGKLWVYGGFGFSSSKDALNDIWYSSDGATWVQQAEHAPWGPRDPLSVVFQDKLWIFSGKHTGGDDTWKGDVWTMAPQITS
jgi:N-acetylneuraminic acid mutarotase